MLHLREVQETEHKQRWEKTNEEIKEAIKKAKVGKTPDYD